MVPILVTSTAPSQEVASLIAKELVSKRLAACVNIVPVNSYYEWQGKVENEHEFKLFIKSISDHFNQICAEIKEKHPYDVPEILQLNITNGSSSYLSWLDDAIS